MYMVFHLDSNIHSIGAGNIVALALNRVYVAVLVTKRHVAVLGEQTIS